MNKYDDIKIFFFDNDSTLFDHNVHCVRETTFKGLRKLKEKGYKLCLNTSRSFEETYNIPKEIMDMMDCIILLNGAYIIKDGNVEVSYMPKQDVTELVDIFDKNNITYRYALDNGGGYLNIDDDHKKIFYELYKMIPPIKKYEGEEVLHLLYYSSKEFQFDLVKKFPNLEHCLLGRAAEISIKGTTKGDAMLKVAKEYGYTQNQTCSFGDGNNDIQMIKYAGLGICMGNGSDDLKKAADYVTDDISSEGLYNALIHFGFISED